MGLLALAKALGHSKTDQKSKHTKLKVGDKVAIHLKKDVKKLHKSNLSGKQATKVRSKVNGHGQASFIALVLIFSHYVLKYEYFRIYKWTKPASPDPVKGLLHRLQND